MGNGMNKVFPGLYVGNFRDAQSRKQITTNGITHVLAIHDQAKEHFDDLEYLCVIASDTPSQNLTQFFARCNSFIHHARQGGGTVLVHCLAGVSRSVTIAAAYVLCVTELRWRDALHVIRMSRSCANPNFGFQKQLGEFEMSFLKEEKKRIAEEFGGIQCTNEEQQFVDEKLAEWERFVQYGSAPDSCMQAVVKDEYPLAPGAYSTRVTGSSATESTADKVVSGAGADTTRDSEDVAAQNSAPASQSALERASDAAPGPCAPPVVKGANERVFGEAAGSEPWPPAASEPSPPAASEPSPRAETDSKDANLVDALFQTNSRPGNTVL